MAEQMTTTAERETLSAEPAGQALYERLRRFVLSARQHQRLLSTRTLAELHGVSVSTARRVLEQLTEEGLIYSVHGKGTFVAKTAESALPATRTILYAEAWGDAPHPYFNRALHGALSAAEDGVYRVAVMNWANERGKDYGRLAVEACREDVCGLIVPWMVTPVYREIMEMNPRVCIMSMIGPLEYPNASSVVPDLGLLGSGAAQRVVMRGARRIALVYTSFDTHAGVQRGIESLRADVVLTTHGVRNPRAPEAMDPPLTDASADAIIFDDDRVARAVLSVLEARDPRLGEHTVVVSHANAGEDILPPYVLRAEFDGYEIGATAMSVLRNMIEMDRLKGLSLKVRPHWVSDEEWRSGNE